MFVHHLASQQIVGYLMFDIRSGGRGRHSIGLRLDPAHANLAPQLVAFMLHQVTTADPTLSIEANLPAWQPHSVEAALNLGFEKRMLYHRMGLKLS